MSSPLLTTKLFTPPARLDLVPRPRLVQKLNEGLMMGRRLTLVSAPAGYGKTTLVSTWLQTSEQRFTWLSLDAGDDDLARFFAYLVAAMQKIAVGLELTVRDLLEEPQLPPVETLVTALINDIAATPTSPTTLPPPGVPGQRFVLVLDDYHVITEPAIHESLDLLVERLVPHVHLVIASRQDPPLALSRLRGRGQVTEIRQRDLRFTPEEAAAFLTQSVGLELAASAINTLKERTEGWIAGLQMVALSLQGRDAESADRFIRGFSGQHHFILDYLTDEALKGQPAPIQSFLLQTSILERMCGPLCDAVVELGDGASEPDPLQAQAILNHLASSNLFIVPLDEERKWYRYHHLFAELLRARLWETQPGRVSELHRRAATWHAGQGFNAAAISHALTAQDYDFAADVIEQICKAYFVWGHSGDYATLPRWLDKLPDEIVHARPWLRYSAARTLSHAGQSMTADRMLLEIEQTLRDDPASVPDAELLLSHIVANRAVYAAVGGEVRQAIALAHQALALPAEGSVTMTIRAHTALSFAHRVAGDVSEASWRYRQLINDTTVKDLRSVAVTAIYNLAEIQIAQGRLHEATQTCEQGRRLGTVSGVLLPATGLVGLARGKILYEQNRLQDAASGLQEDLERLRGGRITDYFGLGHAQLALVRQRLGDREGMSAAIQQASHVAQTSNMALWSTLVSAYQARIWLVQGQTELAVRWARDYGSGDAPQYVREFEDLVWVRVLLADHQPDAARTLLEKLLSAAESAGRMGTVIQVLALHALTLHAVGDTTGALPSLERALRLAEPEVYVRTFVDEGQPMAELLGRAAARGIAPAYAGKLLAAFGEKDPAAREPAPSSFVPASASPLVEPLTEREMQVLQLLAEGLSNREITQRLFISLPTVKSHTGNIYGKLGVHNRKQAVAQARTLGILPPR